MNAKEPKQYLPFDGKPIILHALEALLSFPSWNEIIIVCEKQYEPIFSSYATQVRLHFARPGKERQDSVFSGFKALSEKTSLVCIHDGARPLLQPKDLRAVLEAGEKVGAATLAIPVKSTIKEAKKDLTVDRTLNRAALWEIQTPQVLRYDLLQKGMELVLKKHLSVTDDVSLAELLGHPVQLVEGSCSNLKITNSEDLALAHLLRKETTWQNIK